MRNLNNVQVKQELRQQEINYESQINEQTYKKRKFESSHNNRLGGLIYHPDLIQQHKQMIERKMEKVSMTRKLVEYSGAGLFIIHILSNKLRLSRSTGLLIVIPPVVSYVVKVCGYLWVDNYAERSGLYKMYKVSIW